MLIICVRFCSCLCKVCSRVSEALLLALLTLSLVNYSSADSKAFLCFIAFSGSPTAVHRPLHALQLYSSPWADTTRNGLILSLSVYLSKMHWTSPLFFYCISNWENRNGQRKNKSATTIFLRSDAIFSPLSFVRLLSRAALTSLKSP